MKLKKPHFFILLSLLTISTQSPATDDLSDATTGTFSTNKSQEHKPPKQSDEYNSFGENLYNQNVDTSPYELEKEKEDKKDKKDKNQTDNSND
jgi:hypothetical protein